MSGPPPFTAVCDSSDRTNWLKARQQTIGASESAIVLGVSPWGSQLSLWAEKIGRMERVEPEVEPEWTFWGSMLEDAIIRGYSKRTGRAAVPFGILLRSTKWPWMSATPDALVTDDPVAMKRASTLASGIQMLREALAMGRSKPNGVTPTMTVAELTATLWKLSVGWWPLQIKNVGSFAAEHWADGVPQHYQVQCMHEALVWGADKTTAAGLIAGQKLAWDDIAADPDDIATRRIVNLTRDFMDQHILAGVEPKADETDHSKRALGAIYPREEEGMLVNLGFELMGDAHRVDELKAQQKATAKDIALIENQIRQAMGAAERCVFPDGSGFTNKANVKGARMLLRKRCKTDEG